MSNFLNFAGNSGVTFKTFTASGGTTYTLDKSASTNSVLVSVGGVLQKPATDYSVSGTTLTTTSTVTTGIVIDTYIIHDAGNAPVIEDSSVTRGKLDLVSTSSAPGATIKGDGTTDGYIQLNCSQNSHGIKLKSPAHSAGASYTLVLPTTDGNANEFLQTNGSGVTTWAEAAGGAMTLIDTEAPSAGASAITLTGIDATYATYFFKGDDLFGSETESIPYLRLGDSGGVDSGGSDYAWAAEDEGMKSTSTGTGFAAPVFDRDHSDSQIEMCGGSLEVGEQAGEGCHFVGWLHGARATKSYPILHGLLSFNNHSSTLPTQGRFMGSRLTNLTTTSITFLFNAGTIQGGRFSLFGVKDA